MTRRPGSQIHGVAAHLSRRGNIPQESACHPRMHEAEARGLSQAAVHLQCRVQKGIGPRTKPWGTPNNTADSLEVVADVRTYCVRPLSYDVIHFSATSQRP